MLNPVREGEERRMEAIRYCRCLKIFENFLFSEGRVIRRNFSFENGFGLSIKTIENTKITA